MVYARVDVILSDTGEPFVLEANTIPGMTETSLLPEGRLRQRVSFRRSLRADHCASRIAKAMAGRRGTEQKTNDEFFAKETSRTRIGVVHGATSAATLASM